MRAALAVPSAGTAPPPPVGCAPRTIPETAPSTPHADNAAAVAKESRSAETVGVDVAGVPALRSWYAALLAGSLPPLLLGMVASALADRLVFAGWAAVAGVGHALLLRAAWTRGWSVAARAVLALAWGALALLAFATLVARHAEILDLGYRAMLWPLYTPLLARAATFRVAAAALAVVAAAVAALALATRRQGEGTA